MYQNVTDVRSLRVVRAADASLQCQFQPAAAFTYGGRGQWLVRAVTGFSTARRGDTRRGRPRSGQREGIPVDGGHLTVVGGPVAQRQRHWQS